MQSVLLTKHLLEFSGTRFGLNACVGATRLYYLLSTMMRLDITIYVAIIVNVCFINVPYAKEDEWDYIYP